MAEEHRVPWYPAWGIQFNENFNGKNEIISKFNEWRPNNRWLLMAYDAACSEAHLWTVWYSLRYREINNSMIARSPDTEFIRLISGTHQISTAFDRAGIKEGDKKAWIIYLPNLEVNNQLDKTNLPRDVFNNNTDQAENLILHLEASLITLRPMPIKESLNRLEIAITKNNLTPLEIENYLLNHAAMADLHS
tara:strand:- start:3281 stop:3856 length:576 start_codon:yes stop_codon:yes gene_type:complete